jgi:hypothetical protein
MNWRQLPTGEPLLTDVGRVMRVEPLARIKAGPALVFNCGVRVEPCCCGEAL